MMKRGVANKTVFFNCMLRESKKVWSKSNRRS